MADTTIVTSESELKSAISSGLTPISIANDITLTSMTNVNYEVEIQGDGVVSLIWGGTAITNRNMFTVQSSGFLKVENLILDGGGKDVTLVNITGGQGSIDEGSILRNLKSTSANGAVKLNGGTFTMDGGLITNVNTSEAVQCTSGNLVMQKDAQIINTTGAGLSLYMADLKMSGQSRIAENKSKQAGGGILAVQSTITMGLNEGDSPAVEKNESPSYSGAMYLASGSTLTMRYDSKISGNKAVAFAAGIGMGQNSQLLMYENSSISGNESPAGSGVWSNDSTIKMFDSSSISNNISHGISGGLYLQDGTTFEMQGTSKVEGNSATDGGGIYIKNSTATIGVNEEDAPVIMNNVASGNGGGIFIDTASTLNLSENALISGNQATEGVGIYKDGDLNLSGSIKICDLFFDDLTIQSGNVKSRLISDKVPTIVEALTEDAQIQLEESTYVSPANVPLVIAKKGNSYIQLTQVDSNAFLVPKSFGAGYYTTLSEANDQVLIDLETYNITYGDLFGANNPNPTTYTVADLPITLLDPEERCDYTFIGWFDEEDTQITQIAAGTTGNISITAKWKDPLPEYILTYDSNAPNVSNIPASIEAEEGALLVISSEIPLQADYLFSSWNTAPDGSGDNYNPGDTLTISSDIRLYAQWDQEPGKMCTLGFTGNSLDATNVPESITCLTYDLITISNEIPLRDNYSFVNWNTSADGSGDNYNPGDSITMPTSDLFLYALWEKSPYVIHTLFFDGNAYDATNVPDSIFADSGSSVAIPVTIPTRDDYIFAGWNASSDGSGHSYLPGSSIIMPNSNLTLYAIWRPKPKAALSISFNSNAPDATNIPETILVSRGEHVTLTKTIPVRKNYSFTGWNTSSDGTGTTYIPGLTITMPDTNLTLYAQWRINPNILSTLVFNGNASGVSNLPHSITARQRRNIIIPLSVPVRADYSFLSWNTSPDGTGTAYLPGQVFVISDNTETLYAQWMKTQRKTYFISFNGNDTGISNIPSPIVAAEGDTVILPTKVPTRSTRANCRFSSWNTSADGRGTTYFPGQTIIMPASHLTLYAQWNTGWVNISFVRNDFSDKTTRGIPCNMRIAAGQGLRIPRSVPTRSGYIFTGWRTTFENQQKTFNANDWVGYVTENMTFVAQWSRWREEEDQSI